MFDRLSNEEIARALDELIGVLGVKEEIESDELITLLQTKRIEGCVQGIAARFGLPIRINLSYVPKDYRSGNQNRFSTSALAQTKGTGRGTEGITAQVSIPQNLPMFGTAGLQDYPIQVRVSENCHEWPDAFVAMMAHEISHVLLASLWSIHKDSELHTDLVPLILGFRDISRRGRKTTEFTTNGTVTTTYGYLTDSQFEFACNYVTKLLGDYSQEKERLLEVVEQAQIKIGKVMRSLTAFRESFRYLDSHPPNRMSKEHAERVVQLHGQDYSLEWEGRCKAATKSMKNAEAFARPLNQYWPSTCELLKTHLRVLEAASKELDQLNEAIIKDIRILEKHSGFAHKLRIRLSRDP